MMNFKELVTKTRSFRRFDSSFTIKDELLLDIVDTARLTASAANRQLIQFYISNKKETNKLIFPHLTFAGYLLDWDGPTELEQPSSYILLVTSPDFVDLTKTDTGIVAQTISLACAEHGLGSCMIGAFEKKKLTKDLKFPDFHEILLVIAIGKPVEEVVIDDIDICKSIQYYRDEKDKHHVPKRKLKDMCFIL